MQITADIDSKAVRPIITVNTKIPIRSLIDTGAVVPVWVLNEVQLRKVGAKLYKENVSFSGFGGRVSGNAYKITLQIQSLIYVDLPVIVAKLEDINFQLILPATIFEGMIYEIDTINHKLNLDIPDNQPVRSLKLRSDGNHASVFLAGTYNVKDEYFNNIVIGK